MLQIFFVVPVLKDFQVNQIAPRVQLDLDQFRQCGSLENAGDRHVGDGRQLCHMFLLVMGALEVVRGGINAHACK